MTKTEFLLTILVQNQEDKWWEPRKVYIRLLLVDPIPNSQTWGLQVTFSNDVDYCEIARKAGFQVFIIFLLITTCIITLLSINLTCTPLISHSTCIMYLLPFIYLPLSIHPLLWTAQCVWKSQMQETNLNHINLKKLSHNAKTELKGVNS